MRVVVADDVMLTREGIVHVLEEAGVEVVAQADDADNLLAHVRGLRPDVAIIDIKMPPTHTDEDLVAAQRIRAEHPDVGVLVLSQSSLFSRRRRHDPLADLSGRKREVLSLVAEGLSNRAIAARLFVAERTVEAHVTQIFLKLGLHEDPESHRRVLAVLAFLRR